MAMIKKSISITQKQSEWIRAQIDTGHFGNESEVVRDLIRERQRREEDATVNVEALRAALVEGEQSGLSDLTLDEIWAHARSQD